MTTELCSPSVLRSKETTRCAHAPGRHALRAGPSDVTSQRQQEGRCASHVCRGRGRAHGELRGAGAVRANAGGAGRQPVLGHLHCEQVRGPGRGRPAHRGAVSPLSPVRPSRESLPSESPHTDPAPHDLHGGPESSSPFRVGELPDSAASARHREGLSRGCRVDKT